jgi:hypothetical protein
MTKEVSLPIRKLLKNTSFYPIMGNTKIRKILLTELKTKHNVFILRDHVIQFFILRNQWYNIPFNSTYKEILSFLFLLYDWLERTFIAIKKKGVLPLFVKVKPCYFPYSMDMLIFNACSTRNPLIHRKINDNPLQSCLHLKILFPQDFIGQSPR